MTEEQDNSATIDGSQNSSSKKQKIGNTTDNEQPIDPNLNTTTTTTATEGTGGGEGTETIINTETITTTTNTTFDDNRQKQILSEEELIEETLYRLTSGIPKRELNLIIEESDECEKLLLDEIALLEKALLFYENDDNNNNEDNDTNEPATKKKKKDNIDPTTTDTTTNATTTTKKPKAKDFNEEDLDVVLETTYTPIDRYWTASALLGRLRNEMILPSIYTVPGFTLPTPNTTATSATTAAIATSSSTSGTTTTGATSTEGTTGSTAITTTAPPKRHSLTHHATTPTNAGTSAGASTATPTPPTEVQIQKDLYDLQYISEYKEATTSAQLLALWKKISSNRAAVVFKRPVRAEEAPGYTDRIYFPMDLSVVRKLITNQKITSFYQLHTKIHLISHNCVKYNGRESDYGRVAREFEAMADEYIKQAVYSARQANQQRQLQHQQQHPAQATTA